MTLPTTLQARSLLAFAVRARGRLTRALARLSAIGLASLLLGTSAASGAADPYVPFVTTLHVQSSMRLAGGTAGYNFVLNQDCPPGTKQVMPGCKTLRVRYSFGPQDGSRLSSVDVLRPADPPEGWGEFPLPEGFPRFALFLDSAQWAVPVYRRDASQISDEELQASPGAIVFHGYYRAEDGGYRPVYWVSLMNRNNNTFLPAFPVDVEVFPRISTDGDPRAYSAGPNSMYLKVAHRYLEPYGSEHLTEDLALFFTRDVPLTHRGWDAALAEKAEHDVRQQKEEAARLAQEKQEAAEEAAWLAKINSPQELKAAQRSLTDVFTGWSNLIVRNRQARGPCDSVAQSSGNDLARIHGTYVSVQSNPGAKGMLYQVLLRDARTYYSLLQQNLGMLGCGR